MQWFCSLEGHEFLLPLDRAFLQDKFNMVGLHTACEFPKDRVRKCMLLLMSKQQPSEEDLKDEQFLMLNQDTSDLYGVLHARYIRSREGLALVYGKYQTGAYGYCPRAFCDKQKVVPNAMSDKLRQNRVKVFCPKCEELYIPQTSHRLDGAYFGSSLAHIFF